MHSQESIFLVQSIVQSTLISKKTNSFNKSISQLHHSQNLWDKITLNQINNNLETLDNNLTLLQKYPNDSELASETIELLNALKQINKHLLPNNQIFDLDSYNPTIQNLINNLKIIL